MKPLILPYPPSANTIWRAVNGRTIKSLAYRKWLKAGHELITLQKPVKVLGRYKLTIVATRPDNRARDIDNLAKPTSDLLKLAGVIEDDHLCESLFLCWSAEAPRKDATVRVEIEPATGSIQLEAA